MAEADPGDTQSIAVRPNGPYVVNGSIPIYRRRAAYSEHGEPLTWETTSELEGGPRYVLCRCGQSANKPYCDSTHRTIPFVADDGARDSYDERARVLGGTAITVRDDRSICVHAGFCGSRVTNVWKQVPHTSESAVRAQVIAMVERCPSGALTYQLEEPRDVEPLLATAIAVVADGPLWVTGRVAIRNSDGAELERRNRVTLCRCGGSANKPLCDGSHKENGFRDS